MITRSQPFNLFNHGECASRCGSSSSSTCGKCECADCLPVVPFKQQSPAAVPPISRASTASLGVLGPEFTHSLPCALVSLHSILAMELVVYAAAGDLFVYMRDRTGWVYLVTCACHSFQLLFLIIFSPCDCRSEGPLVGSLPVAPRRTNFAVSIRLFALEDPQFFLSWTSTFRRVQFHQRAPAHSTYSAWAVASPMRTTAARLPFDGRLQQTMRTHTTFLALDTGPRCHSFF